MFQQQSRNGLHVRFTQEQRMPPLPYPEPPRVINPRPLVPDLSLASDAQSLEIISPNEIRKKDLRQDYRLPTHRSSRYKSPPRPTPPPHLAHHQPFVSNAHVSGDNSQLIPRHESTRYALAKPDNSANVEIYRMLKHHDEQLQIIAEKIEELLSINEPKPREIKPKMCTVETMTSMVWPEQARRSAEQDSSASSDVFYENMLANIDGILQSSVSESEGDKTRSSCSPTPPRIRKKHEHTRVDYQNHQISSETIYINRLASKYLVTETKNKITDVSKTDYETRFTGSSREASSSIATQNYLEKYGLMSRQHDTPPRGQYTPRRPAREHHTTTKMNRILDLDRLKRQAKYT